MTQNRTSESSALQALLPGSPETDAAVRISQRPSVRVVDDAAECEAPMSLATRVLVADDDMLTRTAHARAMRAWGYECTCVGDGTTALVQLAAAEAPRLALIDWEMPGLNGVEVCRVMRSLTASPYVYIIMITGMGGQQHLIDALASGADDFIRKPVDMHELEVRLRAGRRIVQLQDELLRAQHDLEYRAAHDSLTRIKNRGAIIATLEQKLRERPITGGSVSVVLFDLDHFKRVNDTLGHQIGDAVLSEVATRAALGLPQFELIGRYGGEEFLAVLPGTDADAAVRQAERLRALISRRPIQTSAGPVHVTASFGVATSRPGSDTAEALIGAADRAMYEAKSLGRDRTVAAPARSAR